MHIYFYVDNNKQIEIYRQRYETWRYLDKLRWQFIQLLVAIISAIALIIRATDGVIGWCFPLVFSMILLAISFSMHKVSEGLRGNQKVLHRVALLVGDDGIPDISAKSESVFHWITILTGLASFVFFSLSIFMLLKAT